LKSSPRLQWHSYFCPLDIGAAEETGRPIVPAGHVELFNGKDFSGWTFCLRSNANPALTWTVTNGMIHCTGKPNGYLRTQQAYRDFQLTVEWRFLKVAPKADNPGIFVHMQLPDQVWPMFIQNQENTITRAI
jgi:hypothetical protein